MVRLVLRSLVVAATAVLGVSIALPGSGSAESAVGANPVVLVHGWTAGGLLPDQISTFQPMIAALETDGHPVYYAALPGEDNVNNAKAIARTVQTASSEHGDAMVDVVGHSMGGLSARYYIKYFNGVARVAHYVSIGTGQYGWQPTCVLPPGVGGDMCPNSSFLHTLNRGDDTPGPVAYTTLRTQADDQFDVSGQHDRWLDGGACVRDRIDGGPHKDEPSHPTIIALVRQALDGVCPGTMITLPVAN